MAWDYEQHKQHVAGKNREKSVKGRDIGPIPDVDDPARRESCRLSFRQFAETYFSAVFCLAWSDDHLRVIQIIEDAVLRGGLFAVAMPRGSGKTSLALCAATWAVLYGHRSFVVLVGASEDAAVDLLENIKVELETNDALALDFPTVCHPIRQLEGIVGRAAGQLLEGESTRIGWTAKELILPTVPGAPSSGAAIKVAGITGRIRGMSVKRPSDGATIRPDLVLVDDPQTDESARSPKQVRDRINTVNGAILGLSGPGKKIAGVMPCTVIAKGDVADQVLDRKLAPEWQGERIKLLRSLPTNVKGWEQYAELRANGLRAGKGLADATAYYIEHKAELDAGAVASWPARFNPDEASAVQNAMNLKLASEEAFAAEYQNEPLGLELDTPLLLKPDQVWAKAVAVNRGIVPDYATHLTCFVDVQGSVLFYVVAAWGNGFRGHVVDYGSYPDQPRSYFTLREISHTMKAAHPGKSFEGYLRASLDTLTDRLLTRDWQRQDGEAVKISRLMIDANWGDSTAVVKQFQKESPHSAIIIPAHGQGYGPEKLPMNDYRPVEGERAGWNWRVKRTPSHHINYDGYSFKTLIAQRFLLGHGEDGSLSLFSGTETAHRMFAEHVTAEYPDPTEAHGRKVNVWREKPNRENHYLDCLVGCAVAASEQGVLAVGHLPATGNTPEQRKRRKYQVSY